MTVRLAFEREAPPDFDPTTEPVYSFAKSLGFVDAIAEMMARSDFRKRYVINPGYEPFWQKLAKAKAYRPEHLAAFVKSENKRWMRKHPATTVPACAPP